MLIRRALDSGRTGPFLLVVAYAVLLAAACGAATAYGVLTGTPLIAVLFALPLAGAVQVLVTAVLRRWWDRRRPHRPALRTTPGLPPATGYPRSRAGLVVSWLNPVLLAASCLLVVAAALRAQVGWLAAVAGLLAVAALLLEVPFVLGRVRPGGLYLSATGVEHDLGLTVVTVPWDGLRVPPVEEPLRLRLTDGSLTRRRLRWWLAQEPTDGSSRGEVVVSTAFLHGDAADVVGLLRLYAEQPHLRARLGTPETLAWTGTSPTRA